MFDETKYILSKRADEIGRIIRDLPNSKTDISTIQKSLIILMAYNLIEGVFSTLLSELFVYFIDNNIDIEEDDAFTKEKRYIEFFDLIIAYHLKQINSKEKLTYFRNSSSIAIPIFSEYAKEISLYSGNLDACKIREISKKFGVSYKGSKNDCDLLYIKDVRNKLAHGEIAYSVACRDKTDLEITTFVNSANQYMNRVINAFEQKYT